MGTSFSVNITSIALNIACSRGIEIEIVDPEPISLNYNNIKYFRMTARRLLSSKKIKITN